MRVELIAQVTSLTEKERYPFKPGTTDTDYSAKKVKYIVATCKILDTLHNINGTLEIETEQLNFKQFVGIIVDTDENPHLSDYRDDITIEDVLGKKKS